MRIQRSLTRASVLVVGALALVGLWAGTAAAHVTVSPGEASAGGYTVLTFSVPHGCEELATTQVKIQMPEAIPQVTPTVNPNWDVEKVMETLDEPLEAGHGEEITERVSEVVYTAKTPLPDGLRDTFELSLQMPDTPGETLYFPVVQLCDGGEAAWIELPADGETDEELDYPAPAVVVGEAEGDGHGASDATDDADAAEAELAADTDGADAAASDSDDDSGSSNALAIVALMVGAVALAIGGLGLARTRQ